MQLVPWILAILWTLLIKNYFFSSLLAIGTLWQLREIYQYRLSFQSSSILTILLLCWTTAAFYAKAPVIALGMLLQLGAFTYFKNSYIKEKKKDAAIIANYGQQTTLLYELRKQRHDLQKHTSALLHADRFSDNVKDYRAALHSRFKELDEILSRESNVTAGSLFAHYNQAREKGVTLEYYIQHAVSGLPLPEHELISFIGNILQNAIEAAYEYKAMSGEKGKALFACRKQSGIWMITCQNNTKPLADDTIEKMYTKRAFSTKGGDHEGFGTQQIKRIVETNGGSLDFSAIQNNFTLKIKIPDIKAV